MTLEQAADAVECIVTDGVDAAMNRFNWTQSLAPDERSRTARARFVAAER